MPNAVIQVHRRQFPDDARSDDELTLEYASAYGDDLFKDFPDFESDFRRIKGLEPVQPDLTPEESARLERELYPRSLPAEFGAGLKRGGLGLASTAAGAAGLGLEVLGADETAKSVMEAAQRLGEEASAPELAPTVKGVEGIDSLSSAIRFAAGGAGEVLPSVAEALVTGAAGAIAGSATAPGPGTVAGGVAGLVSKEAAKQMIKKAVRARIGATVASVANSYGLNAGEIYNDLTRNPNIRPEDAVDIALLGGAIAAVPDTALPSYVISKFFPKEATKPAKEAVQWYVTRLFLETAKVVPFEAGTEAFQEFVGIASEKYGDPTKRDAPLTPEEWSRIKNAAALGGIGGGVAAPVAAIPTGRAKPPPVVTTPPPPADGLDMTRRYETERQEQARKAAETTATVTALAQKELTTGLDTDDLLKLRGLSPEALAEYDRIKEQLRKDETLAALQQEGLSAQQAADLMAGKISPEQVAEAQIQAFQNRVLSSVDRPVPTMEHAEAVGLAYEQAVIRIKEILKGVQNATQTGAVVENREQQRLGTAAQLQAEEEDRTGETEVQGTRAPDRVGDSTQVGGTQPKVLGFTTSQGSEYTVNSVGHTTRLKRSSGRGQGEVHGTLPVVFVSPDAQNAILDAGRADERVIIAEQGPDGQWKQIRPDTQTDLRGRRLAVYTLNRKTGETTGAYAASTEPTVGSHPFEIGYAGDDKTFHIGNAITQIKYDQPAPVVEPPQPVSQKNLFAIAQDFLDRMMRIPNLTAVQQQRLNMVWTMLRNPQEATPENLANFFGLTIDDAATAMPDRFRHVQPIQEESAPVEQAEPTSPVQAARSVATAAALAPPAQVQAKVASGRAAATAAVLERKTRRNLTPAAAATEAVAHPIVEAIDFESRKLPASEGAAYFPIGVTDKTTNDQLKKMKLAAGRSSDTSLPHSTTHRLTAMQRPDGKVVLMPTYISDETGNVVASEPGRKKARDMKKLIGLGYKPLASLYLTQPVNAIDYAKPVFGTAAEFEASVGRPASERMQAAKRTAEAVRSKMGAFSKAGAQVIGLRGDETVEEAEEAEAAAALAAAAATEAAVPETVVEPVIPTELVLPNHLADGIYAEIQAVIESERGSAGKRGLSEIVFDALVNYAQNGKYGNELQSILRDLAGHLSEAATSRLTVGRIVAAYQNSRTSEDFVKSLSGQRPGTVNAAGSVGGLPVTGADLTGRTGQPGVPAGPAPSNRGVAGGTRVRGARGARGARLRIGTRNEGYHSDSLIASKWQALLDVLTLRGVPVQVFEQHLTGVTGLTPETQAFLQRTGGGISDNGIVLVVSDLTKPTNEDFVAVLHEAAHEVFARETPQMQAAIHAAIDRMGDVQLGIQASEDPRIRQENPAGLDQETLAEERLVESFAQQGFDPAQSRGLAQALWRFLKDLYYRASIALQQAFYGPEHVRPERVQEYFNNRVRQFLSNDPVPTDFLSFLGGGKPTAIRQSMFYVPHDHSFVPVLMDWQNGRMEYQDFIPDTVAAALLNIENSIREQRAMFTGAQAGPVPHRVEPPAAMRDIFDSEGVIYIGSMEVPSAPEKSIHLIEIYDPIGDPRGIHGANISFREGTSDADISARIASKRAEFGWQAPRDVQRSPRLRAPGTVSGPEVIGGAGATVRASWDFGAAKKVGAILRAAFDQFNAAGLNQTTTGDPLFTYETFFDAVKGDLDMPESVLAAIQQDLGSKNLTPVNPDIGLDGPVRYQNEFTEKQVQSKALAALQKWQKSLGAEYLNATNRVRNAQRVLERKLSNQERLAGNYQDLAFHFENVKEAIGYLLSEFKSDLGDQLNLARRLGTLMQSVKSLQERQDQPLPSSYANLVNRMARRITDNEGKFMDFLRTVSQLDIDWENTPLVSSGDIVGIRDLVSGIADANSLFTDLDPQERNALIAITASFAKQNDHAMAWLAVREANDHEASQGIKDALAQARKETNVDLRDARRLINRVPRMAVRADRIFRKYLEARQEAQRINDQLQRDTKFISAYQEMEKVLAPESQKLEAALSGNEPAALTEGEKLPYVNLPTDTPEMLKQNTWDYHVTGDHQATPAEVRSMIDRYNSWLDNNRQAGGLMWNRINDLVKKLEMVDVGKGKVAMTPSFLNRIFGSLSDAVNASGTPSGRVLAQMMTRYSSLSASFERQHAELGYKIIVAAGDAMKATGLNKRPEMFYDLFHDQALKFIENRRDLQETPGGPEAAMNAALNALRLYFSNHPDAKRFMSPTAWQALDKYYRLNSEQTGLLAKTAKDMGIQVRDENLGMFRDPLGQSLFTHPRGMSASLEALFGGPGNAMRAAWGGTRWPKLTADDVTAMLNEEGGAEKLRALLTPRFTPQVWDKFVKPMAHRSGRALFNGRRLGDGRWKIADVENVRLAFAGAGGDALTFATGLAQLEGVAPEAVNEFVGETMDTFQKFFDSVEGVMHETEAFKANAGIAASVPRYLMDARISEEWPAEWLSYQRYDQNVSRNLVHLMAYHASFGRNGATAFNHFGVAESELQNAADNWQTIIADVSKANPKAGSRELASLARSEAKARGQNWRFLENAESHLRSVRNARSRFVEWFRTQTSDLIEAKTLFESVGTLAGLLVQGPKTALVNTMDMVAGPVIQVGLNRRALDQVRRNWQSFATSIWGSLVQQVGITTQLNSENMLRRKNLGYSDPASMVTWKERLKAELSAPVAGGAIATAVTRAARAVRTVTQVGIPTPVEEELSPRLKPQAAFTQIGQWMNYALIDGVWFQYEDMALRAKEYMQAHPEAISDPAFKFTWQDLGYPKSLFSDKSFAFESLKEGLNRWGMTIEGIGRAAVKEGAPLFSEEQYRSLASMAMNELSLESGPVTRPAWFHNPIIRFITPLLGWSFSKTGQLRKAFREPGGDASWYAAGRGIALMTAAMLPVGLLYGLLMQKYDEEITGKKSDIRGFGQDNNVLAAIEQLARVGTFGLWGDLANTVGNLAGQGDLRGLSVDNRVIAVNSMLNAMRALTTFVKQGEATYATVYRPLLQSAGGSGYLQYAQILNNFTAPETTGGLPLVGQFLENERRVTSRINVTNWLRSAGRELNLDVRMGRGGQAALPNSVKPHVGEMFLAALADDVLGFQAAYQDALQAAREEGKPDAEDHVKRSFQSYHPLTAAFRTKPSVAEYQQMLARLPDDGRNDVQTAINLFNRFGSMIGVNPSEGKEPEKPKKPKQFPSIESIRRRALGKMFDLPTFGRN